MLLTHALQWGSPSPSMVRARIQTECNPPPCRPLCMRDKLFAAHTFVEGLSIVNNWMKGESRMWEWGDYINWGSNDTCLGGGWGGEGEEDTGLNGQLFEPSLWTWLMFSLVAEPASCHWSDSVKKQICHTCHGPVWPTQACPSLKILFPVPSLFPSKSSPCKCIILHYLLSSVFTLSIYRPFLSLSMCSSHQTSWSNG